MAEMVGCGLILMFNKNSGARTVFYSSKTIFLIFFILAVALSQNCLQFSGSDCVRCASGYQLVSGGCVSMMGGTSNPILVFMDVPGVQKVLYSVSSVLLSPNSSSNQSQGQGSVVNEFQVVRVNSSSTGNYYEVRAKSTKALQDINNLFNNSSLLTEINQKSIEATKSDINQENATQSSTLLSSQQVKQSDGATDDAVNLTAIKQITPQENGIQPNLTSIRQIRNVATSPNLTLIQQKDTPVNFTPIKQGLSGVEPVFVPVKQAQSTSQVPETPQTQDTNLTKISENQSVPDAESNITSSNQNNSDLLVQLQQISQRLTQVNQAFTLTQAKMNQPTVSTPAAFTQATQKQPPSSNGGAITLQLTQVGQQLTQVNQQLTQAKMADSSANLSSENTTIENANNTDTSYSPPLEVKINEKQPNVTLNLSQFVPLLPATQPVEPNMTAIKAVVPLEWVKATRYQLYNLTLVSKALAQVKPRQGPNATKDSLLTFKCSSNLTVFLPPNITDQSYSLEMKYSKYITTILAKASKQLHDYTLADHSTLCFDPPFHAAFKSLNEKHKAVIATLPLLAVYYQFCGFAKTFRVFFLDDTALPAITIHQTEVVVDLYRMAPAEVFFTSYATITL